MSSGTPICLISAENRVNALRTLKNPYRYCVGAETGEAGGNAARAGPVIECVSPLRNALTGDYRARRRAIVASTAAKSATHMRSGVAPISTIIHPAMNGKPKTPMK